MRELFLGEYIKQERTKQNISQQRLCEGICEPITLSRLENGKQMPSYSRIRALLQRLGLPDERFYALLSEHELEVKTLEDEIRADVIRFERASPEDRPHIQAEGLQKLEQLEKLAEPDDRILRQYIIGTRVTLGKPDGPTVRKSGWNSCWRLCALQSPTLTWRNSTWVCTVWRRPRCSTRSQ